MFLSSMIYKNYPDKSPIEECFSDNSAISDSAGNALSILNFKVVFIRLFTAYFISITCLVAEIFIHYLGRCKYTFKAKARNRNYIKNNRNIKTYVLINNALKRR